MKIEKIKNTTKIPFHRTKHLSLRRSEALSITTAEDGPAIKNKQL